MSIIKRLDHLEGLIEGLHRADVTVRFNSGDVAQMPLADVIPLLQQGSGITRVTDTGNGNGAICDLINDMLEG